MCVDRICNLDSGILYAIEREKIWGKEEEEEEVIGFEICMCF